MLPLPRLRLTPLDLGYLSGPVNAHSRMLAAALGGKPSISRASSEAPRRVTSSSDRNRVRLPSAGFLTGAHGLLASNSCRTANENTADKSRTALHGGARAAAYDHAGARLVPFLVLCGLAGLHVAHELLNVRDSDLGDLFPAKQRQDVMVQSSHHSTLVARLEMVGSFLTVKLDELADSHFSALGLLGAGRIFAVCDGA